MASSRYLIASNVLGSSAASVTFSSIPSTYTDLVIRGSARTDRASNLIDFLYVTFNSDTATNYSDTMLFASVSSVLSSRETSNTYWQTKAIDGDGATANTFGSFELYIPSYTISQNKPLSGFATPESNATDAYLGVSAGLWRNTAAITSINITKFGTNFVAGSSFYLYGLKSS